MPFMQKRRGFILVIVLVVIVLLMLSVFTFSRFMRAHYRATNTTLRQTQARLLAESGVEYLRAMLFHDQFTILELGGLYDNPDVFCGHIVTDGTVSMTGFDAGMMVSLGNVDRRDVGRFSVVAPALSEDGILLGEQIRYGVEDESSKINLRWILQLEIQYPGFGYGRNILMRLPGINEEIADSLLDYVDGSSDEPREYGAKDEYYTLLDPPFYTRNGMIDSLDDLLNVRGVTPKLLYGLDWNRNGVVDYGEPGEESLEEFDVIDGSLNLGLLSYLTLDSRESMLKPDGFEKINPYKINVNMDDLGQLRELLDELETDDPRWDPSWTNYIITFRQTNPAASQTPGTGGAGLADIVQGLLGTGNTGGGAGGNGEGQKVNSLIALVGGAGSPFSSDPYEMLEYGPVLYDNLTTSDEPIVGRININQASRTVLEVLFAAQNDELTETAGLLGAGADSLLGTTLTEMDAWEIIEGIIATRISDPYTASIEAPEMNYPFWVYTSEIITDLEVMKRIEPYFCTQGAVFKATVVGRFDVRSPTTRMEVWLDASEGGRLPKVIRSRDISELGPGYSAEWLGADELFAR
jgi:hypothetical protein